MIEAEGLAKNYAKTRALAGAGFAVPAGTILGLLGPNGAGDHSGADPGLRTSARSSRRSAASDRTGRSGPGYPGRAAPAWTRPGFVLLEHVRDPGAADLDQELDAKADQAAPRAPRPSLTQPVPWLVISLRLLPPTTARPRRAGPPQTCPARAAWASLIVGKDRP